VTAKTPAQRAYEAFYAGTELGAPVPWPSLTDWDKHWKAAAEAVAAPLHRDLDAARARVRELERQAADAMDAAALAEHALAERARELEHAADYNRGTITGLQDRIRDMETALRRAGIEVQS
jgi:hypothetical protein